MKTDVLVFVLVGGLALTGAAEAQGFLGSPKDCEVALKTDVSQRVQQYAYLSIIDEKMFTAMKHDASIGVGIPLVSGLVNVSGSYSDFKTKRRELFQRVGYEASSAIAEAELSLVTAPAASAASACSAMGAPNRRSTWPASATRARRGLIVASMPKLSSHRAIRGRVSRAWWRDSS